MASGAFTLAVMAYRQHRRIIVQQGLRVLAWLATVWVVLLLWGNAFPPGLSSGVLVAQTVCLVLFPSIKEALAYTTLLTVGVVGAGVLSEAPIAAYGGLASTVGAVGAIVAVSTRHRVGLAEALVRARDRLEDQVETRTEELRSEVSERRGAELRALEASAAKSRFLANMSHELRTPLNAILGYSELIGETVDDGDVEPQHVQEDLHAIQRAGHHLLALVDDVLDLSRIEAGSMDLVAEDVDVGLLVERAVQQVRPQAAAKGLEVVVDAPGPLPAQLDPRRVHQIMVNLLSNAAKFTSHGSIGVQVRQQAGGMWIGVQDTGIGIAEHDLDRLFTPFVQLDDTSTRLADGTGLGLALSRDLAQRMGGDIRVRSELGAGSCFTLVLPRFPARTPSSLPAEPRISSGA